MTRKLLTYASSHGLAKPFIVTQSACDPSFLRQRLVRMVFSDYRKDNVSLWKIVLVYGNDDKHRNPCSIVKQQLYISYYSEKRWKQIYQLFHKEKEMSAKR